jgi:hypothetical protein
MVLDKLVQQLVERLIDLNCYLLYFLEEKSKQLDQNEIIEILDQAKAWDSEWHEAMLNANHDSFEIKPTLGILTGMNQLFMTTLVCLKYLMKNLFLTSSVWRTRRKSGAPTV